MYSDLIQGYTESMSGESLKLAANSEAETLIVKCMVCLCHLMNKNREARAQFYSHDGKYKLLLQPVLMEAHIWPAQFSFMIILTTLTLILKTIKKID